MVTIITEKLRNQKLDDLQFAPISQQTSRKPFDGGGILKADTVGDAAHVWGDSFWRRRHASFPQNVLRSERAQTADGSQQLPCSAASEVPPLKRHCRSLSVPGDQPPRSGAQWQPQAGSIWRPVRTRKNHRSSPLCSLGSSSSSSIKLKQPPRTWSSLSEPTPPETPSPVPRPASASSGFCSQASLWTTDGSPGAPPPGASPWPSAGPAEEPCPPFSAVSMPTLPHHHVRSTPSSPRRQRVPRCRSQPSLLSDRKGGLKRRREESRPTLDFFKMKETALENCELRSVRSHSFTCGGSSSSTKPQRNVQFAPVQNKSRALVSLFTEPPECFLGLNTIASSPLDPCPVLDNPPKPLLRCEPLLSSASAEPPPPTLLSESGCSNEEDDEPEAGCFLDATGEQFDLEINNDLDLEQIEKD
ncbi:hypothetical protein CAPTEDRAFT_219592 [Capitella teleta]|uniref:Uncharacterized protein n=1 Tax=Capitella teleta TaxID=283909 RepID=R7UCN9_CAPTE|nr:hypothetical protein CAPTEDRAFT_219592 [Capitella teleta]|eukprot:ELU04150.1 hypothetical protein CAPTEDRAFT_219592 [Capitella teleta]